MEPQNFSNHRRWVPAYHFLLSLLLLAGVVISVINVARHWSHPPGLLSCLLISLMFICMLFVFWYMRQFPIKAQDRAIRAEEALRYYILTGKPLSNTLSVGQIVALRFASDEEFSGLTDRAMAEGLSPDDIKKAIANWRADHHRA